MAERKPPEGKGYDLQKVYAEGAESFWFRWADQWWEMPHPKMLDFEVQVEIEAFDVTSFIPEDAEGRQAVEAARSKMNEFFTMIMGVEQGAEWAKVPSRPLPMMLDMLTQWRDHTKASMGEAPASTGSSKSTGRPSKRTSTASTGSASRRRSKAAQVAAGLPGNS